MKRALLFLGVVFSILTVSAEENVLQTVEIIPVKDTYNIVLSADRAVDVKKTVQAPNQITLEMKGIRASKTLNTIYNNVSNVDTIMVEPAGNGINLFFQAENASGASVSFDSLKSVITPVQKEQKVKLNNPIESYAPIYKDDLSNAKTSGLFDKITKKSSAVTSELQESIDDSSISDTVNKTISFVLVASLAFAVIKLFRRREPEMKIGLSQNLNEREIDMYKGASPINNNYANIEKPFTTVNYGINAYRKENQNPYEPEIPIHNPRLRNYAQTPIQNPQFNNMQTQPISTVSYAQPAVKKAHSSVLPAETQTQTNPSVDNLKFLESMTAIYEKSGRHDLAQGLKTSLYKNNLK